jgi:threonine/homoserine/homoserine lactone efflux protein
MIMHFIFGLVGSFLGGVAFGPINLSVVDITLKVNMKSAIRFSIAAAFAELLLAYIAIMFGKIISRRIEEFPELKLLVIAFFIILGLFFILKKDTPKTETSPGKNSSKFLNGFVVAILNPQVIPYWIFVLAYLKSANVLYLKSWHLLLFLAGISLGKLIILTLYGYLSEYIKRHFANINDYVSKTIGSLLIVVGLVQAINYFFF